MMKNLLLLVCCFGFLSLSAQDYNKWSLELQGGVHKPIRPFSPGYNVEEADFFQVSAGVRYMFNNKFGVKLDAGYNQIENAEESLEFENNYFRGSIQGVANLGNLLNFNTFTQHFTILGHGGFGYSSAKAEDIGFGADEDDAMFHAIIGVSPQVKLSDRVTFVTDLSIIGHVGQDVTWDGQSSVASIVGQNNARGYNGMLVNVSAGININLGSADTHADWYYEDDAMQSQIDSLQQRIATIEDNMIDEDKDGVPNYLDQDNTTESGVTVDTRGEAIDLNNNGIPDEMESPLDERYMLKSDASTMSSNSNDVIRDLLDKGYVNVYFKFNSVDPAVYSLEAINYLIKYMDENPGAKADLTGYADEIGPPPYNEKLSTKRAKRVYEILVAAGIDSSRLSYNGDGEDARVNKNSAAARQLMRRVTFTLR